MDAPDFIRVATVCPNNLEVGNVFHNAMEIASVIPELIKKQVSIAVFPELCLTGYTCGDLFHHDTLMADIDSAIDVISAACDGKIMVFVGAPVRNRCGSALYNCALCITGWSDVAVIPKRNLPNYGEFYEKRWFTEYDGSCAIEFALSSRYTVASSGIVTTSDGLLRIGCEICEDVWVPGAPSDTMSRDGAMVIVNLSGGNEILGKSQYRRKLIEVASAKNVCAYVYCNAGMYESTQDMVFSGHSIIAEAGTVITERCPFTDEVILTADIDLGKLRHDRIRQDTFRPTTDYAALSSRVDFKPIPLQSLERIINAHPFTPEYDMDDGFARCYMVTSMQAWGLVKRFKSCHCTQLVIGISGGLDSTLALLVAVDAMKKLNLPAKHIIGITMPGMGTTDRTKNNATILMEQFGITSVEIPIRDSVLQHLKDIGHPDDVHDVTYENAQARERTQILFDYANMHNGIVVGTGDLSELALGWCTYNGDQMSNYGVNSSIPKTLVKFLVKHYANQYRQEGMHAIADTLDDIVDTPISPELLPADKDGKIAQKTEDTVGSYELVDFFLYNMLRNGAGPRKLFFLAHTAVEQGNASWTDDYIKNTLKTFITRFFSMQFKRSCMPDGPKVGSVTLSPRGDWRMPSDAVADAWLRELNYV